MVCGRCCNFVTGRPRQAPDARDDQAPLIERREAVLGSARAAVAAAVASAEAERGSHGGRGRRSWASFASSTNRSSGRAGAPTSSFQSAVSSEGSLTRRELAAENEALKAELRKSQRRHHKEMAKLKASMGERSKESTAAASSEAAVECNEAGEASLVPSDSLDSSVKAGETREARVSLLELKEARRSMQGAELARERAEAQLVAVSMEKENLEVMLAVARESLMSRRSLGVRTDLGSPQPDEIALLRADLAACIPKACAVDETSKSLDQYLEKWASSADTFGWSAPKARLQEVGELLRSSREALESCRTALAPLLPRLTQRRVLRVPGPAATEEMSFRKYLEQHLFKSAFGGGLMARADWGTVQPGMRLVAVDGKRVPLDASLDTLAEGSQLEIRSGTALSFIGCRPEVDLSLFSDILSLLLRPVDLLLRLRDFSNGRDERAQDEDQIGLPPPHGPAPNADDQDMDVWQERLVWEAELAAFDREVWHALLAARAVYLAPTFAEEAVEDEAAPLAQGQAPSVDAKGKGKGKGKLKGKGAPPAPKKKAGPPGSGNPDADVVERAAVKRKDQPLFGRRTRPPDQAMLAKQHGTFPTFVDKVASTPDVASIREAFGERGCLLLHACIAEAPGDRRNLGNLGETESAASATHLMQIVRGESGSMGDMRRMDAEIRFRKFAPCGRECLGRGLVPRAEAPCKVAHELASAVASLDFEALTKAAASADVDLTAFFPVTAVHPLEDDDRAESEKINQAFLTPEEQQHLEAFAAQVLQTEATAEGEPVEDEVRIEHLHSLERRLLPFLHVPSLPEKVKIHHVCTTFKSLAESLLDSYSMAESACQVVQDSRLLLDVLGVTLQIASYVKNFGDTDLRGQGFSFMKLQYYSGFWIGRHQFLSVLCAFLMNLRPRDTVATASVSKLGHRTGRSQPPVRRQASVSASDKANSPGTVGRASSLRASSRGGRSGAEDSGKGKGKGRLGRTPSFNLSGDQQLPSAGNVASGPGGSSSTSASTCSISMATASRKGPNFLQLLEGDLAPAREAYRRKLSTSQLENQTKQLEHMARFIEKCQQQEVPLFLPRHSTQLPAASDERHAELSAWHAGKERLQRVFDGITASQLELRSAAESLRCKERELQQFAGVRKDEFETVGYIDIIGSVLSFIDALRQRWAQHDNASAEMQELQRTLLAAAPLQMLFASSCLGEAFDLWRSKAQESFRSGKRMQRWDDDLKHETLKGLFALFDTNADGAVDAEELRVTIQAFGLELPDDAADLHLQVVRHFDQDGDGKLDLQEFKNFVASRIRAAFGQFVSSSDPNNISEDDLRGVAGRLKRSGIEDKLYARMIGLLDSIESDNKINVDEFEQLVLLAPSTAAVGRISSGHELNWSKTLVRKRSEGCSAGAFTSTSSRIFAWDSEDDKPLLAPPEPEKQPGEVAELGPDQKDEIGSPMDQTLDGIDLVLSGSADLSAPMKEETSREMAAESTATTAPCASEGMDTTNSRDVAPTEVEACPSLADAESTVLASQQPEKEGDDEEKVADFRAPQTAPAPAPGPGLQGDTLLPKEGEDQAKAAEPEATPEAICQDVVDVGAVATGDSKTAPLADKDTFEEKNKEDLAEPTAREGEAGGTEPTEIHVFSTPDDTSKNSHDCRRTSAEEEEEEEEEKEHPPPAEATYQERTPVSLPTGAGTPAEDVGSMPTVRQVEAALSTSPIQQLQQQQQQQKQQEQAHNEPQPRSSLGLTPTVQADEPMRLEQVLEQMPGTATATDAATDAPTDAAAATTASAAAPQETEETGKTGKNGTDTCQASGDFHTKGEHSLAMAESASNAAADEASPSEPKLYKAGRGPARSKHTALGRPVPLPPTSSSSSSQDPHQQMREKMARRLAHQKAVQRPSAGFLDEDEAREIAKDIIREGRA